jgi:hypothetical protein
VIPEVKPGRLRQLQAQQVLGGRSEKQAAGVAAGLQLGLDQVRPYLGARVGFTAGADWGGSCAWRAEGSNEGEVDYLGRNQRTGAAASQWGSCKVTVGYVCCRQWA